MGLSTKMNPGGNIYTTHPATKKIPFIQGAGVGAVSRSIWVARNRSVATSCKCKLSLTK